MHYCNMLRPIQALDFDHIRLIDAPMVHENRAPWTWCPAATRDHYNLWVCLDGCAKMNCAGVEYDVVPWSAFILPPDVPVRGQMEEGVLRNFAAHWRPEKKPPLGSNFSAYGIRIREVAVIDPLVQCLLRLSIFRDALALQQAESIVLSMLGLVWREHQMPPESSVDTAIYPQVERMRAGRDLFSSVDALAKEANLSRMHYSRCFARIAKMSPNQYMIQQRIERACLMLLETQWTVAAIADKIGYSDSFFFSRQFRRIKGQTPGQYRARKVAHSPIGRLDGGGE